jgi:Ras-related protein Rab-8A
MCPSRQHISTTV